MRISWSYKAKLRDLLASERGTIVKPWGDRLSVALVYPNQYHVAMSNLGFQRVYHYFNSDDDVVCERSILPDDESLSLIERRGEPIVSLESQSPLSRFDIVAFSLSFESDYINVLRILELSKIPIKADERREGFPLVICGGACSFFNPEPMAPFVDIFIVGEVEGLMEEIIEPVKKWRRCTIDRSELFRSLARVKGVYVPSAYEPIYASDGSFKELRAADGFPALVQRRISKAMGKSPAASKVLTDAAELGPMYLVEVSRGCARNCWFCLAGYIYRPPRQYSKDAIMKEVMQGLSAVRKVGLVGTAAYDHPDIGQICGEIIKAGGAISISSLRVDALGDDLIDALAKSGHKTISLGIEAGSEKLRKAINKGLSDEQILGGAERILSAGIPNLKLYFMIGLPGEADEAVHEIIELLKKINHIMVKHTKKAKPAGKITVSLNCFVPKPFTPFQWEAMEEIKSLNDKIKILKAWAARIRNLNLIYDLPKWSFIQALLARGDRKVADIIMKTRESRGDWFAAIRQININPAYYVYRRRDYCEALPWDHINIGISKDFLIKESVKSREILSKDEGTAKERDFGQIAANPLR